MMEALEERLWQQAVGILERNASSSQKPLPIQTTGEMVGERQEGIQTPLRKPEVLLSASLESVSSQGRVKTATVSRTPFSRTNEREAT